MPYHNLYNYFFFPPRQNMEGGEKLTRSFKRFGYNSYNYNLLNAVRGSGMRAGRYAAGNTA